MNAPFHEKPVVTKTEFEQDEDTASPRANVVEFAMRALGEANCGVALLLRSNWMESRERYELFTHRPPHTVAVFSERVPMTKGRWDPNASTATSYAWFCWLQEHVSGDTRLMWIPPGQRKALEDPEDRKRFASERSTEHA